MQCESSDWKCVIFSSWCRALQDYQHVYTHYNPTGASWSWTWAWGIMVSVFFAGSENWQLATSERIMNSVLNQKFLKEDFWFVTLRSNKHFHMMPVWFAQVFSLIKQNHNFKAADVYISFNFISYVIWDIFWKYMVKECIHFSAPFSFLKKHTCLY